MQWDLTPISTEDTNEPSLQRQDLVSYSFEGGVYLIYGIDTPVAPDAYQWVPPGPLSVQNNTWQIMAWGYDSVDVPYTMFFETWPTGQPSQFYFISRSDKGIAEDTYQTLVDSVKKIGNQELNEALTRVYRIKQDGGRHGETYAGCNATCKENGEKRHILAQEQVC